MPKPTAKDKCPVCGMFVAKYYDWMGVIVLKEGSRVFSVGQKNVFKYLLERATVSDPLKKADDIDFISVTDYYAYLP